MSKEQEIKIKINKKAREFLKRLEYLKGRKKACACLCVAPKTQKREKFFNSEKLAIFFYALVFDADFCAPAGRRSVCFRQSHSFLSDILLTAFF